MKGYSDSVYTEQHWCVFINYAVRATLLEPRQHFRCHAQSLTPLLMVRSAVQGIQLIVAIYVHAKIHPKLELEQTTPPT